MTPCPECIDGKGQVTLFRTVRPCRTCAARRAETAAGQNPLTYTVTCKSIDWDQVLKSPLVNGGKWPPTVRCPP